MIALVDVQVVLNRLSWQRVWSIPPAESAVSALAWRPDGRGVYDVMQISYLDTLGVVALAPSTHVDKFQFAHALMKFCMD